ncbi:MAG: hypothetical protein ACKVU4_00560 [Phycisphaerales bacterium]
MRPREEQVWLPDSPLLLAIGHEYAAQDPPSRTLYVGASLGGGLVKFIANGVTVPWSDKTFTALKFRGAVGGLDVDNDGEVCEFRWIGGEINPTGALTNSTLPAAFVDLGFLGGP